MLDSYILGTVVRFCSYDPSDDTDGFTTVMGAAVDPDNVAFAFSVQGDTPIQFTYGAGPTIVRDGVGLYHADIDTGDYDAGVWDYSWAGWPNVSGGADATHTQVVGEGECLIELPTVAIPIT
jgi:hypothetical protein